MKTANQILNNYNTGIFAVTREEALSAMEEYKDSAVASLKEENEKLKGEKWISVNERLPTERSGTYLACNMDSPKYNQCVYMVDYFTETEGEFKDQMKWGASIMGKVTHWQPLPKLPTLNP
jgi:hypothetical protein